MFLINQPIFKSIYFILISIEKQKSILKSVLNVDLKQRHEELSFHFQYFD